MYDFFIRLIFLAALTQLGISATDFFNCRSKSCSERVARKTREVLNIEWKPISIFPEEAKKFR